MVRTVKILAVMLVLVAAFNACSKTTGRSAGQNFDDASITASVKSKLVADNASSLTRTDIDTNNGTVYLNGIVESPAQRTRAERLAWQAKGVKAVVNNLQVQGTNN